VFPIGRHSRNRAVARILDLDAHGSVNQRDADADGHVPGQSRVPHAVGHELGHEQPHVVVQPVVSREGAILDSRTLLVCGRRGARGRSRPEPERHDTVGSQADATSE
jgi:hypothetical protein